MKYIKDVVTPETKKSVKYPVVLCEYFHMIGCHIIMAFYIGYSVRELCSKSTITHQKVSPSASITSYLVGAPRISLMPRPTKIVQFRSVMTPFSQKRQMEEGWNNNITPQLEP